MLFVRNVNFIGTLLPTDLPDSTGRDSSSGMKNLEGVKNLQGFSIKI